MIVELGEIGRGVADAAAASGKGGHHLLDRAAKTLGEEPAAGEMQPGLGLAAALIDRKRIGLDHRLAQRMNGASEIRERTLRLLRQYRVAVAAGDLARGGAQGEDAAIDGKGGEKARDAGGQEARQRAAQQAGGGGRQAGAENGQSNPGPGQRLLSQTHRASLCLEGRYGGNVEIVLRATSL